MMKNMKGQAAMEFLMTYGWAILVVLLAIGALAAFGVFDMGKYSTGQTSFQGQKITNVDDALIDLTNGYVEIAFKNNAAVPITMPLTGSLTPEGVTVCTGGATVSAQRQLPNGTLENVAADSTIVREGENLLVRWTCTDFGSAQVGDIFEAGLSFAYTNTETGQQRTITGSVQGKYE